MSVAQIKLPLDPAPRLVFQLAATIAIVDRLSLCLDQLKLYLVVELGELPAAAVASVLDLSQPFAEMRAVRPDQGSRKLALTRQLAEPLYPGLDRQASSNNLLFPVGVALSTPRTGKAERTDHCGQHQALSHQGHQDH